MFHNVGYIIWFFIAVLILAISACSSKTLSVFFDGVPLREDTLATTSGITANPSDSAGVNETFASKTSPGINYHAPYQNKECFSCHNENSMGKLITAQPDLCYQCHDNFSESYSFLHAPVELGECTSCHNPHLSESSKLLIDPGQQLCLNCHERAEVIKNENHEGIGDATCYECHNPHGGNESNLLY